MALLVGNPEQGLKLRIFFYQQVTLTKFHQETHFFGLNIPGNVSRVEPLTSQGGTLVFRCWLLKSVV